MLFMACHLGRRSTFGLCAFVRQITRRQADRSTLSEHFICTLTKRPAGSRYPHYGSGSHSASRPVQNPTPFRSLLVHLSASLM